MSKAGVSQLDFLSSLSLIPGLGPRRLQALDAAGLKTVGDLLYYYPVKYIDRSKQVALKDVSMFRDSVVTVSGTVERVRLEPGRKIRFRIMIRDESGSLEVMWFAGAVYQSKNIKTGDTLFLTGKINHYAKDQMVHPIVEKVGTQSGISPVLAIYSIKETMREAGINQKQLHKSIEWIFKNLKHYPQVLPAAIEQKHEFAPLKECLYNIHLPENFSDIDKYKLRLKYEELYKLALALRWNKRKFALPGYSMTAGGLDKKLRAALPFTLTDSQEQAVKILYDDAAKSSRMHRLLQGDVGSGKTVTALMASLPALNTGRQVAWMAPTDVLARQTHATLQKYLDPLGFGVGYLGGGSSPEKTEILKKLASGELQFVVGTHALFMPSVRFYKLGMIVIDEQHKFGASQRLSLQEKGPQSDFLLMSATPIPQTLAKTLYGDLDTVEIRQPSSRIPVSTHIVPTSKRGDMENFLFERIQNKSRVFYVVPRIEQDEDEEGSSTLRTVDSVAEKLKAGPLSSVPVIRLHGQMSSEEREDAVSMFKNGKHGILVSTTIIEVGVDVIDANVMVIENPEFFGLAQLHQIRGRVGRGDEQSYCFLLPGGLNNEKFLERLNFLRGCHDGFAIAEWDLLNRGPGDVCGSRQSGWDDLKTANILEDAELFREILQETNALFEQTAPALTA
ncbi:MAG: ATP-dependent DNA helicase RecG [Chitinispirillales bacterium]|jgi:ATP-dependent DNA helicase RecG|nr:ATP-dependent DNA helicase RecG [Chitinispirillales bacterium]